MSVFPDARPARADRPGREMMRTLLEGGAPWGVLEVAHPVSRHEHGWGRYSLTVYPPGTNGAERVRLTFARRWPVWGAVLLVLVAMVVLSAAPAAPTVAVLAGAYLAGLAAGRLLTRRLRPRLRRLGIVTFLVGTRIESYGEVRLFKRCVADLDNLDARRRAGAVSAIEYEAAWARIYARIEDSEG